MNLGEKGLTDVQSYIEHFEANNMLVRVKSEVDSDKELAAIASKFEGQRKAVLFENIKDRQFPVLIGLYWHPDLMSSVMGCDAAELPFVLADEVEAWLDNPVVPEIVKSAPANEVVESEVDLSLLPLPHHAVGDGGRYITCSAVIAKDPDTGERNLSIHRMLVLGKNRLSVLFEETGDLRDFQKRAEAKGQDLEITISNGIDYPAHIGSATPGVKCDETGLISQMRGEPVQLLRSQSVNVESIASAQFVLEGRILANERATEGPYAEVTGYYAQPAERWVIEISAITRRKNPTYHAFLSGLEQRSYGLLASASIFKKINRLVPEVTAVHFAHSSVPYHLIVRMNKQHQGRERDAMMVAFASLIYIKTVTVVDDDVNIYDPSDVDWAVQTRCRVDTDLVFVPNSLGHDMSPVTIDAKWTRLGIDATKPADEPADKYFRVGYIDVDLADYEITG